jgi:hypothetical protein
MARNVWLERLDAFKKSERPEVVLMVAGQAELMRIAVTWMHTDVTRARRLTKLRGASESEVWSWLWENAQYDREGLLARIPSAAGTEKNLAALIANRVLYPDGTLNSFVERYLKERVVKLFAPSTRKRTRGVA